MNRPNVRDVWQIALKNTAEELSIITNMSADDIFDDLMECAYPHMNGYEIAKQLDNRCLWAINMEIIEALDEIDAYSPLNEAEKEWVRATGAKLTKKVGDMVEVDYEGKKILGEITNIIPSTAEYVVYCESLGHVKKGVGTHGIIVQAENIIDGIIFSKDEQTAEDALEAFGLGQDDMEG